MEAKRFKDNAIYVCANKTCGSKNNKFFKCTFNGKDLNNNTTKKDEDCKAEQITVAFSNYIKAPNMQYPYKYILLNSTKRFGNAYAFNTLECALQKLKDIADYKTFLYEVVVKYDEFRCNDGTGLKLAYTYNTTTKKINYEEDKNIGLHIEWYIDGKNIIPPPD